MASFTREHTIPAAYAVLPAVMRSAAATAMLLAIGLQESRFEHRLQIGGPARGFWQFERSGGVAGVLSHPRTRAYALVALEELRYPAHVDAVFQAIAHNDVLACVFARLLLWTLPMALPTQDEPERAWAQYLGGWRPGRPHPSTWRAHYADAWEGLER